VPLSCQCHPTSASPLLLDTQQLSPLPTACHLVSGCDICFPGPCPNQLSPLQVNSRYEFYDEINLSRPGSNYFSKGSETSTMQRYKLLSVLVHAGANHGGHYYAYVRPNGRQWLRFDDESVTLVEQDEAIAQQFGEDAPKSPAFFSSGRALPLLLRRPCLPWCLSSALVCLGDIRAKFLRRCLVCTSGNVACKRTRLRRGLGLYSGR
jgi:hypothetical protein